MMDGIMTIVSEFTGVSIDDLFSKKRNSDICTARRIFMYLAATCLGASNAEIAIYLNRTRQNIHDQLQCIDQELRIYRLLNQRVKQIKNAVL